MIKLNFNKLFGLVPVVIQDFRTREVLMLGFMNSGAFEKTKQTGLVWFWSRSKKRLWMKGEKSGNTLLVRNMLIDCDQDSLLIKVEVQGKQNVCHMGEKSCFFDCPNPHGQGMFQLEGRIEGVTYEV